MEQKELTLNEFIESIDKIKAKYFVKGQMALNDNSDLSIVKKYQTEISKIYIPYQYKIGVKWYHLRLENENMDFWEAKKFERFLNNEVDILKYIYFCYGPEQLEVHKSKLNRLREIYNKRFSIETKEPEPPIGKITAGQKYFLLKELGFFETKFFKGFDVKIEDRQKIVAKLLSVEIRTARAFMNDDEKYMYDPEKKKEIEKLLKDITKSKGK